MGNCSLISKKLDSNNYHEVGSGVCDQPPASNSAMAEGSSSTTNLDDVFQATDFLQKWATSKFQECDTLQKTNKEMKKNLNYAKAENDRLRKR